jgi:DNA adenine methylase
LSYLVDGDPIEQARRTIVRSMMGFGSHAASGQKTGFRTGMRLSGTSAAHDWMHYPPVLDAVIGRLRGVTIENRTAIDVLRFYDDARALHFVDPPYPHTTRGGDAWYRFEMTDDDHRELASVLHSLKGMVVLSGYACDLYDLELYADWQRVTKDTHADGARDRTEVLWISQNAVTRPQFALEMT